MKTRLYRPIGLKELQLIIDADFRVFPPRLPWQPIFYPVMNVEYAVQIANQWNTKDEASGYCGIVTHFDLPTDYLEKYEVHNVGSFIHNELWVPAEELDDFNNHIIDGIIIDEVFIGHEFDSSQIDKATQLVLKIKKQRKMNNNRDRRAEIAQQTLDIIEQGFYITDLGLKVDLSVDIKNSIDKTELYSPQRLDTTLDSVDKIIEHRNYTTNIIVDNCTAMEAVTKLQHVATRLGCLNFASAKNPGGGFLGGSQAQEESLTRASTLYPTLMKYFSEMYEYNRAGDTYLYSDYMIYSPDVVFFRDDHNQFLEQPYTIDIITSPAVNIGAMLKNKPEELDLAEETMLSRMDKILAVFVEKGVTNLILGAWGCGVFKNDPNNIAHYFSHYLQKEGKYSKSFENIFFAVYHRSKNLENISAFSKVFR